MGVRSLSELRDVSIVITGAPMPIDGYKALVKKVEDFESIYLNSLDSAGVSQGLSDLTAVKSVATGNTPYRLHVFNVTTVYATGTYTFDYVETVPNAESITP